MPICEIMQYYCIMAACVWLKLLDFAKPVPHQHFRLGPKQWYLCLALHGKKRVGRSFGKTCSHIFSVYKGKSSFQSIYVISTLVKDISLLFSPFLMHSSQKWQNFLPVSNRKLWNTVSVWFSLKRYFLRVLCGIKFLGVPSPPGEGQDIIFF